MEKTRSYIESLLFLLMQGGFTTIFILTQHLGCIYIVSGQASPYGPLFQFF